MTTLYNLNFKQQKTNTRNQLNIMLVLTMSRCISLAIFEAVRKLFTAENIFPSNVTANFGNFSLYEIRFRYTDIMSIGVCVCVFVMQNKATSTTLIWKM